MNSKNGRMNVKLCWCLLAVTVLVAGQVYASGWGSTTTAEGPTTFNNQLVVGVGTSAYDIGNTSRTWYWDGAQNIAFQDGSNGGSDSTMQFSDINGGASKLFQIKFQFDQPLASFQFETPQMNNHIIDLGSSVSWAYSTDGSSFTTLWQYNGVDNTVLNFAPVLTPLQTLGGSTDKIWLQYTLTKGPSTGYGGQVLFYDSVNDGGVLFVTGVPEPSIVALSLVGAGSLLLSRRTRKVQRQS